MRKRIQARPQKLYQLVGRFLSTGKRTEMEPVRRKEGTMVRMEENSMEGLTTRKTWGLLRSTL